MLVTALGLYLPDRRLGTAAAGGDEADGGERERNR